MKNKHFLAAAIVGTALVSASPASALSVNVTEGTGLTNGGTTAHLATPSKNYGYYLGSFDLDVGGSDFVGFCLDLLDSLSFGGTYTYNETATPFDDNPIAAGTITQIKSFFDFNYGGLGTDATKFAAFQLGLWELVYDGPISATLTHFTTGNLTATTSGSTSIIDTAVVYLNKVFGTGPDGDYTLTFLDSPSPGADKQDLVYGVPTEGNVGIVPLPAAGWLLGVGLISLFGVGRFKKASTSAV